MVKSPINGRDQENGIKRNAVVVVVWYDATRPLASQVCQPAPYFSFGARVSGGGLRGVSQVPIHGPKMIQPFN
jgi:hypothetical protein